jgi:hypothetical protein
MIEERVNPDLLFDEHFLDFSSGDSVCKGSSEKPIQVARVDRGDLLVVHCSHLVGRQSLTGARASGYGLLIIDERIDRVGCVWRDGHSDPAYILSVGKSAPEFLPCIAAIGAFVQTRAVAALEEIPSTPVALPHRSVEHTGVARVHGEIDRPGLIVGLQYVFPSGTTIVGAINAALFIPRIQMSYRSRVDAVRIRWVNQYSADVVAFMKSFVHPRFAAVFGFEDSRSGVAGSARVRLTGAQPNGLAIATHGDVADDDCAFLVEQRRPCFAHVFRAPQAAGGESDIQSSWFVVDTGDVYDASALAGRADVLKTDCTERSSGFHLFAQGISG